MELTITKDKKDLERLEGIISKNIQSFYEVGRALMEIRDRELYKVKNGGAFITFETYCKGVWDFNSSRARQLMMATETLENIKSVTIVTPITESQARPLAKLQPDQQREAWAKAVETAPEGKVTAAHVYRIVKEMTEPEKPKEAPRPIPHFPSDAINFAGMAISQLSRIHPDDPNREAAYDKVINWIKKHREGGK